MCAYSPNNDEAHLKKESKGCKSKFPVLKEVFVERKGFKGS